VDDLLDAMLKIISLDYKYPSIYNLGNGETITIKKSASIIADAMNLNPKFCYQDSKNGWVGDNPIINLDVSRLKATGWVPKWGTENAVADTVSWSIANKYIFR
jgi:nucleoside-diphosphate-sugar epimerase